MGLAGGPAFGQMLCCNPSFQKIQERAGSHSAGCHFFRRSGGRICGRGSSRPRPLCDIACPSARSLVEGARTMLDARNSEQNLSAIEEAEANPAGQTMPQVWMPFLLSWKIWLLQSMDFKET